MTKNRIILTLTAMAVGLLAGCVGSELQQEQDLVQEESLQMVPVSLSLRVSPLEAPGTKAVMEPEDGAATTDEQIKNIVVLQFDGTTSDAKLLGSQQYFDHWPLNDGEEVTLAAVSSACTVIVLANTFVPVSISATSSLGDFLENDFTTISSLSGVFTRYNGDDYLRMSGASKLESVAQGTAVTVNLKRNCAKVVINVTNSSYDKTGDDKVTLTKVQLLGINGKYYYAANFDDGLSVSLTDPYDPVFPFRFNNPEEEFPAAGNTGASPVTYTYYVPVNLRGTTDNAYQYNKANGAPAGSTYFSIYGTYGAGNTGVLYTYYLGGNLTNDFDLLPNHKYTYNIDIASKGNSESDYRVDDMGDTTFTSDANCYMLHPPLMEGKSRIYSIPVRRAAVFWNAPGVNGGVYGASTAAGYSSYVMDSGTNWTADVLWSDFDMSDYMSGEKKFLAVDSGTGFDPSHAQPYIKVRVSSGMKGNVVVAVRVNGTILWSWHLWITDYDPDIPMTPEEHRYEYDVKNGHIHRYFGGIWNTDPTASTIGYKNGFIMDRLLGALGPEVASTVGKGVLYQWGRKDPFVSSDQNGQENKFYLGGTTSVIANTPSVDDASLRTVASTSTGADGQQNARYAVTHPTFFITGAAWTAVDDVWSLSSSTYWADGKFYEHTGDQTVLEQKKSIYDPCPAGWKVPAYTTFESFKTTGADETYTLAVSGSDWRYYPEGYVNRETTGFLSFSRFSAGYKNYTAATLTNFNARQYVWLHVKYSTSNNRAYYYYFAPTTAARTYVQMGDAMAIRCVRE